MKVKVCLIQDSPVFFDKEKTLQKVEQLTANYAKNGCQLIVFPESFIPGYPRGFNFGATVGSRTDAGRELYLDYYNNSLDATGKDIKRLEQLAKNNNIYIVIGATQKQANTGSLCCAMLYISPTHGLLATHSKIKPTGSERIIWAEAGGESLVSCDTKIGRLGGLICWENYMPLARMSMYKQGVQIYIAPTADSRPAWTTTMQHIALEGRCFVLGCNQFFTKDLYPDKYRALVKDSPDKMCPGGSVIVSPMGNIIAGPLFDEAGALIAELDLDEITQSKLDFDPAGHYARPDIFKFEVIGQPDTALENTKTD